MPRNEARIGGIIFYERNVTKTAFTFNDVIYEQVNGVSMGGTLGPLMANIILTELEDKVVRRLINPDVIKFYCRYVYSRPS